MYPLCVSEYKFVIWACRFFDVCVFGHVFGSYEDSTNNFDTLKNDSSVDGSCALKYAPRALDQGCKQLPRLQHISLNVSEFYEFYTSFVWFSAFLCCILANPEIISGDADAT